MKIMPDRQRILWMLLTFVCFMCAAGILWYKDEVLAAIFLAVVGTVWAIRYWFTYGREIELDAEGITITFLCHRKKVAWKNVKSINTFCARNTVSHNSALTEGLEIFLRKAIRPKWLRPDAYGLYLNSRNYIFFSFSGTERKPKGKHLPVDYKVDEKVLIDLLHRWEIPVEEKRGKR